MEIVVLTKLEHLMLMQIVLSIMVILASVHKTSTLPAFLVLGKASLNVPLCAQKLFRYDATEDLLVNDFSQQKRILKRRYFLIEKAMDASIIGILVGTLGVGEPTYCMFAVRCLHLCFLCTNCSIG